MKKIILSIIISLSFAGSALALTLKKTTNTIGSKNYATSTIAKSIASPVTSLGVLKETTSTLYAGLAYDAWPSLALLSNGTLFACFSTGTSHTSTDHSAACTSSTDSGATWKTPVNILSAAGSDYYVYISKQIANGNLFLFTIKYVSPTSLIYAVTSTDNGTTWQPPVQITAPFNYQSFIYGNLRQLSNGNLITTVYGASANGEHWTSALMKSTDNGATWTTSTIAYDGANDFNETSVLNITDTNFLAVIRKEGTPTQLYYTSSTNGGATWATPILFPGFDSAETMVAPDLLKLTNGDILLCAGKRTAAVNPKGEACTISQDNGLTWLAPHDIWMQPSGGAAENNYGYGQSVQLTDGSILSVYYLDSIDANTSNIGQAKYNEDFVSHLITDSEPARSHLVGWYTFDGHDISGTAMTDKSGNGNTSTMSGVTLVKGKIGQGGRFNGSTSYVDLNFNSSLNVAQGTLSAWFKLDPAYSFSTAGTLLNVGNTNERAGFEIAAGPKLKAWITTGGVTLVNPASGNLTRNAWHFAAFSWDGIGMKVLIDGAVVSSSLHNDLINIPDGSSTYPPRAYIGRYIVGSSYYFKGDIDDVRVYNRALSAVEMKQLYQAGVGTTINKSLQTNTLNSSLAGWWTFDGANMTATQATDKSGNGKTGTRTAITPVKGKIGQGAGFNGSTSLLNVGSVSASVQTVAFWMKTTSSTTRIIDYNGVASTTLVNNVVTNFNITPTVYVNGAVGSTITSNKWNYVVLTSSSAINVSALKIGQVGSNYYLGSLDDVRVWNRVLSAKEITQLYNMGK